MSKYILGLFILFFARIVSAQTLEINGSIVIEDANPENARVVIFKNNQQIDEKIITKKGRFDLKLAMDGDYKLSFEKAGYITKIVSLSTEVPQEILETNPNFPPVKLIMNLLPQVEGVDISIFEQPIAIMAYDYELDDMNFDKEYASKIKDKVAQTEQEVKRIFAMKGSAAREKERMFAELTSKGQQGFDQKKWTIAIDNWSKALEIKPGESILKEKLAIARKENELESARLSIEAQNMRSYQLLVRAGDSLFNQHILASAREKYAAALQINDKDNYPSKKIAEIDNLLAQQVQQQQEETKRQALIASYKQLIALADEQFKQKNYNGAEGKYTEALALNYEKDYPQQQLKAIADIRRQEASQLQQEAEKAAAYTKAIAAADNHFNSKNFEESIKYYRQGLDIKPAEAYPKEMIAKAEQGITQIAQQKAAEVEKARQEEQRKARLMNEYSQIIAEADIAFKAENYAIARSRYISADELQTGEVYPKNKIKEIDNIFNSAKYKQRLNEFNASKELAEKAMAAKNYASAKFYYQKAITILPIDKEVIEKQIAEIDKLIEAERQAAIDKEYKENITKADNAYKEKSYAIAKFYYQKALSVKPDDTYAKKQLTEVESFINNRSEKTMEL